MSLRPKKEGTKYVFTGHLICIFIYFNNSTIDQTQILRLYCVQKNYFLSGREFIAGLSHLKLMLNFEIIKRILKVKTSYKNPVNSILPHCGLIIIMQTNKLGS